MEGYDCFNNLQVDFVHRGIIIYVRKTLNASPSQLVPDFSESVWCEIPLEKKDRLLLGCTYRSPNSTEDNNKRLNQFLQTASTHVSHVLLTGDFNHPEIEWKEEVSPGDINHKPEMPSFSNMLKNQHTSEATNLLDLILTVEEDMVSGVQHLAPLGKSHHQILKFTYRCYSKEYKKNLTRELCPTPECSGQTQLV